MALPETDNAILRVEDDKVVARHTASLRAFGNTLAVSADGTTLVAFDQQQNMFVLNAMSLDPQTTQQIDSGVLSVAIAPDGSRIAYITSDANLHFCNTSDLKTIVTQKAPVLWDGQIGFSSTGKWLTHMGVRPVDGASETEHQLTIYDGESGKQVASTVIDWKSNNPPRLLFSEDDTTLYISTDNIRAVSVPELDSVSKWKIGAEIRSMAANEDEHILFCGTASGNILVVDTRFGHLSKRLHRSL